MLAFYRVQGDSMSPVLFDGDFVLTSNFLKVHENSLVVVKHSQFGVLVKRVKALGSKRVLLEGENNDSLSSNQMGWVERDKILGVVLKMIKKGGVKL
jgi:phage repressor protein C with HTH and peptisase S24 domain